jgi:Voltage gated chloride channel
MPAAMEVTQEPGFGPRPVREHGSLLVLALLAFAVGGISGLLGAVFRLVLERSDRFRGAVIDWAHDNEIAGLALIIGISAIATGLAARLVRKFAPGAKGSGIPDVEAVLLEEQPPPPLILIPVKFLGGVLAMGTGLALGREGPTVQMGAGIGHFLATAFRRNQDDVKALLAAGAGAGLATAFSAPCDRRCSRGVARMVWARIGRRRRRDHAAHARRSRQHDGCRRCIPATIRPRAIVLRGRDAGRIVCAHASPWGSKRSCPGNTLLPLVPLPG